VQFTLESGVRFNVHLREEVVFMTTITATEARKNLYRLLDEANASHDPIHIAGKRGGAILISEDDWSAIQETLYLSSIPGMRDSIIKGMSEPVLKCKKVLKW
jgi:prevent-host-death family protein